MDKAYLEELHKQTGTEEDFETWLNYAKDNDNYLDQLHDAFGIS